MISLVGVYFGLTVPSLCDASSFQTNAAALLYCNLWETASKVSVRLH